MQKVVQPSRFKASYCTDQRGIALVTVLYLSAFMLLFAATSVLVVRNSQQETVQLLSKQGQAANVAKAGIQDAIGWFKKQESQPVRQGTNPSYTCPDDAFNPQFNTNPVQRDTDNASSGIVKDFLIDRNIFGRYVIKKQAAQGAACNTSTYDQQTNHDKHAVHDVTHRRGKGEPGDGTVWYIESKGIVYQRNDDEKDENGVYVKGPDEAPNRIIDQRLVSVEINRLGLLLPMNVPLIVSSGSASSMNDVDCQLLGDSQTSAAMAYFGSLPTTTNTTKAVGNAPITPQLLSEDVTQSAVFSVTETELKALSDNIYTTLSAVPKKIPMSLVFLDGNFTFTTAQPLNGAGILYVNGNLTLNQGSGSIFSGFIFVDGSLTINGGNSLAGSVVVKGPVTCTPTTDKAVFEYNDNIVKTVRQKIGLYRENNLTYKVEE